MGDSWYSSSVPTTFGRDWGCHSNVTEIKSVIFQLFHLFLVVSVVSVVSLVSVVLFRLFRFVVSGFSTCPCNYSPCCSLWKCNPTKKHEDIYRFCLVWQTSATFESFSCQSREARQSLSNLIFGITLGILAWEVVDKPYACLCFESQEIVSSKLVLVSCTQAFALASSCSKASLSQVKSLLTSCPLFMHVVAECQIPIIIIKNCC